MGKAIKGFAENVHPEAASATSEAIENLFKQQRRTLINSGVDPMLAGMVLS